MLKYQAGNKIHDLECFYWVKKCKSALKLLQFSPIEAKTLTKTLQTTTAVTGYTELETHMKDATVRFDAVIAATEGDDALAQNVPDLYLDPVTLSFVEPDYSRHVIFKKNIATGETSQAIPPFHFFDNFNFHQ